MGAQPREGCMQVCSNLRSRAIKSQHSQPIWLTRQSCLSKLVLQCRTHCHPALPASMLGESGRGGWSDGYMRNFEITKAFLQSQHIFSDQLQHVREKLAFGWLYWAHRERGYLLWSTQTHPQSGTLEGSKKGLGSSLFHSNKILFKSTKCIKIFFLFSNFGRTWPLKSLLPPNLTFKHLPGRLHFAREVLMLEKGGKLCYLSLQLQGI